MTTLREIAGLGRLALDDLAGAEREQALGVLRDHAEAFAGTGGRWSTAEWAAMGVLERAAATAASERVWRLRAAAFARALRAPHGIEEMVAVIDDAASLEDAICRDLAAQVPALVQRRIGG